MVIKGSRTAANTAVEVICTDPATPFKIMWLFHLPRGPCHHKIAILFKKEKKKRKRNLSNHFALLCCIGFPFDNNINEILYPKQCHIKLKRRKGKRKENKVDA